MTDTPVTIPPDYLADIRALEPAYLAHKDPIRQSGFGGGAKRWRDERAPLLEAVDRDGDFLDVGCANGYLAESVVQWAAERGLTLVPHGIDLNPKIVQEAQRRLPEHAHRFWVANAASWLPHRRFRWVYAIWDCVPAEMFGVWCRHMLAHYVDDGGALIVGGYGSRGQGRPPLDVGTAMRDAGLTVAGESQGGTFSEADGGGPVTRFAWVRKAD